jgi:hypothetical protein
MPVKVVEDQAFWYALGIAVGPRATKYVYGTVEALNEYKALDMLDKQATEQHGGLLKEAKLHRIIKDTGEREEDACLLVSPEDGSEGFLEKALPRVPKRKSSQACEENASAEDEGSFGDGWARKLPNPNPVISLKHKEKDHAST